MKLETLIVVSSGDHGISAREGLSEVGIVQAMRVAKSIREHFPRRTYALLSSPRPGSRQTAKLIAKELNGVPIEFHSCFTSTKAGVLTPAQVALALEQVQEKGKNKDVVIIATDNTFVSEFPTYWNSAIPRQKNLQPGTARVYDALFGTLQQPFS